MQSTFNKASVVDIQHSQHSQHSQRKRITQYTLHHAMIDYESLLEFEESLRSTSTSGCRILLQNLAFKIECSRAAYYDIEEEKTTFEEEDLDDLFAKYKFTEDEFTTCSRCGRSLAEEELYQSCCKNFITNKSYIYNRLEKSFWLALINNPTRTINTLPCYTEFLCLRQGIPNQIRAIVWQKLFLLNTNKIPQASILVFQNFQHSYNSEISEQISKDLNRTFPTVDFFKTEETITNLSTILNVYANYDAELGYCQGLLFLVGVLCYHFHDQSELTFHCLISIMESEYEIRDIFTASTMSDTLNTWQGEFLDILKAVDEEFYDHITSFVEMNVFLYQWWLSFISSHSPDLSIVNRIMDFCILQGWKNGMFKISLGLLLINKPILMCLRKGDEEVIYQHLLNESKWGNVINDLDMFFGDTLLSWDESLFAACEQSYKTDSSVPSVVDKFKNYSLSNKAELSEHSPPAELPYKEAANRSSYSVFSNQKRSITGSESIYSDLSEGSLDDKPKSSFSDYLKFPYLSKASSQSPPVEKIPVQDFEKESMRILLKKATLLLDETEESTILKGEILHFL